MPYVWSLVFFFSGPLQEWSQVSYEGDSPGIYPLYKVPTIIIIIIINFDNNFVSSF